MFRQNLDPVALSVSLTPVAVSAKRKKSTIALGLVLTLFILAALYYMVFVITVPCGAGLNGHWTLWQMITGETCQ